MNVPFINPRNVLASFVVLVLLISSISSIYLSHRLSSNNDLSNIQNIQSGYRLLFNQKLDILEDELSFFTSRNYQFKELDESLIAGKFVFNISTRTDNGIEAKDKILWRKTEENFNLPPDLFKNSLIVLFEASKRFLGRPLYGPSYRFEESNNGLPIIYSVKLDENNYSTFTIWLNLDGFVEYINSEYNKNFKDGAKIELVKNNEPKHIFTIDRIPSITLNLVNERSNHYFSIFNKRIYYNTILVALLNVVILTLVYFSIKRSFNRLNSENFKYISFWNQEIQDKISSVRELSSSLSHELNQPLAACEILLSNLKSEVSKNNFDSKKIQNISNKIADQLDRCTRIIQSMNTSGRGFNLHPQSYYLEDLFKGLMPLIELQAEKFGSKINLEIDKKFKLSVDKTAFEQILLNVARNALEAMSENHESDNILRIFADLKSSQKVPLFNEKLKIVVSDSGLGIPRELNEHIFEPFVSNKKDGVGLGLNIVKSLVERSKGKIYHAANSRGGCDFTIELPVMS